MNLKKLEPSQRIIHLISGYISGSLSDDESMELKNWTNQSAANTLLFEELTNADYRSEMLKKWKPEETEESLRSLKLRLPEKRKIWWPYAAAAAIVACLLGITYYQVQVDKHPVQQKIVQEIRPGSDNATLTLAGGEKIDLASAANGQLAQQSNVLIQKTADGRLLYSNADQAPSSAKANSGYNTVSTPMGGQFQLQLPDGTKVWLNAASSLKYPASFSGLQERPVELSGEAYFEVAHDKTHPFIVKTTDQTIKVLGTHFNVNSYADEHKTTTTLEQGKIQVSYGNKTKIITPGEQAIATHEELLVDKANLETALAWKNGELLFNNADIQTIMRQVSRWYNVTVKYEGVLPKRTFTGGMPRNADLSALLKVLALNDIHFEVNGRVITVKP
jgi:ferric-dicitrate binding protein FerR (iron transport regulator)